MHCAYESLIASGLRALDLPDVTTALVNYLQMLSKWNKVYNLTAIRDMEEMVRKHVLDSLAVSHGLNGSRVIDVGTGAGLPGIPLALVNPYMDFTLLDSIGKKTRFLEAVKESLALKNVNVVQSRVEDFHPSHAFDTVISRAFSDLPQMIAWTAHLLSPKGVWVAMKGRYPEEELAHIRYAYEVKPLCVPGLDEARCSVIIKPIIKE